MSPGNHTPSSRGGVSRNARPPQSMQVIWGSGSNTSSSIDPSVEIRNLRPMRVVAGELRGRRIEAPPVARHTADHRQGPRGGLQRPRQPRPGARRPRRRPVRRHRRARHRGTCRGVPPTARSSSATATSLRTLRGNIEHLGLAERGRVVGGDAPAQAAPIDVDLVLADPPYEFDAWLALLGAVRAPFVVAEAGRSLESLDGLPMPGGGRPAASATAAPGSRSSSTSTGKQRRPSRYRLEHTMTTVLIPGSFDPLHFGHVDIVHQAVELFGNVVVGVLVQLREAVRAVHTRRTRRARPRQPRRPGRRSTSKASAGSPSRLRPTPVPTSSSRACATPADFDIEQQMAHMNLLAAPAYAPCSCRAGPTSGSSRAGSSARSPPMVATSTTSCRTPVAVALADRFAGRSPQ